MKKIEIRVGGLYLAKVSGRLVTVRVESIQEVYAYNSRLGTRYGITNLLTGRMTAFRSAAKFRTAVKEKPCPQCKHAVPVGEDHPFGMHRAC